MAGIYDVLAGAFGGLAGQPGFGAAIQQSQNNLMLALDQLKREKEESALKYKLADLQFQKYQQSQRPSREAYPSLFQPKTQTVTQPYGEGEPTGPFREGAQVPVPGTSAIPEEYGDVPLADLERLAPLVKEFRQGEEFLPLPKETTALYSKTGAVRPIPPGLLPEPEMKFQSTEGKFIADAAKLFNLNPTQLDSDQLRKIVAFKRFVEGKDVLTGQTTDAEGNTTAWAVDFGDQSEKKINLGQIGKPGKVGTEITVTTGETAMKETAKKMAGNIVDQHKSAQGIAQSLLGLQDAKKLLESPIILGAGANALVQIGKGLQQLGFNYNADAVNNTQAFAAAMGNQVLGILNKFGSGTGLSDNDVKYAKAIVGADITLTKEALKKIMAINEKAMRGAIKLHNKQATEFMKKPGATELPYSLIVEIPPEENVSFIDAGRRYSIPVELEREFKRDHPNAKKTE